MEKLRVLRAQAGLTLRELEERSGISKDAISEIERGLRNPRTSTLVKLADGLGVDPQELLGGIVQPIEAGRGAGPFTAVFEKGEQGWWVATCPEIPEAITQGRTVEEARENLKDAIRLELEIRREEAEEDLAGHEVIRERIAL